MRPLRVPLLSAALAAATLTACGVIPTPSVDLPDTRIDLPDSRALLGQVVYVQRDSLGGTTLPAALQRVTVRGTVTYRTVGGTLQQVELYVRPDLTTLPASCRAYAPSPDAPGMVVCEATGEAGQSIGTAQVTAGQGAPFSLSGAALDAAAKAGHGYFGVRFTAGQSLLGDALDLTGMKVNARL